VIDAAGDVIGFISRAEVLERSSDDSGTVGPLALPSAAIRATEQVRVAADRMAAEGRRSVLAVDEDERWVGVLAVEDLLEAWRHGMQGETRRHRVRSLRKIWQRRP
jgi:CBS-domain-containing membrane protein